MEFLENLFAAYAVIWTGLFLYMLRLGRRTRQVEQEIQALRAPRARGR